MTSESRTELLVRYAALSVAVGQSNLAIWHYAFGEGPDKVAARQHAQEAMFKELRELASELWPK